MPPVTLPGPNFGHNFIEHSVTKKIWVTFIKIVAKDLTAEERDKIIRTFGAWPPDAHLFTSILTIKGIFSVS